MSSPPPLLVASIGARDPTGVVEAAHRADDAVDLVEVRLDRVESPAEVDLEALARDLGRPALLTLRPRAEGGEFDGDVAARRSLLLTADQAGFAWVDLEEDVADTVPRGRARRVVSWHGDTPPDDAGETVSRLARLDADVVKVAADAPDAATALSFVQQSVDAGDASETRVTAIAMGPAGRYLRPLAGRFGMPLLYTALSPSRKTAAGQLTVAESLARGALETTESTRVFGVAGADVSRSLSPIVHTAVFRALGFDAAYVDISTPSFEDVAVVARALPLAGLSVTAPFKADALEFADDPAAAASIGVANTLSRDTNGSFTASNTDVGGFLAGIELAERDPDAAREACIGHSFDALTGLDGTAKRRPERRRVRTALVFGTGGAARAAIHALQGRDVRVSVTGRRESAVLALAMSIGGGLEGVSPGRAASQAFDLLVKAVPDPSDDIPGEPPFDPFDFPPEGFAADVVYRPLDTSFLIASRRAGRVPVPGILMFAEQAVLQAATFTGAAPHDLRPIVAGALSEALGVPLSS